MKRVRGKFVNAPKIEQTICFKLPHLKNPFFLSDEKKVTGEKQ